jgi:alkanesulfonate monooxygenase SsuD/methylene tetrahydromethanopterin reductase-like flavin-dependent oxidoreductase (luciferase family)
MYWPWFELDEQIALAEQADRLGFDSVWAGCRSCSAVRIH